MSTEVNDKNMLREELKQTVIQGANLLASLIVGILVFTLTYTILLSFGLPEAETTLVAFGLLVIGLVISRLFAPYWRTIHVTSLLRQDKPSTFVSPMYTAPPAMVKPSIGDDTSTDISREYIFSLGVVLYELRNKRGLTEEAVAEQIGVSKDYISSIERGLTKGSADVLERILRVLGMSLWELEYEIWQRMKIKGFPLRSYLLSSTWTFRITDERLRENLGIIMEFPATLGPFIRSEYRLIDKHSEIVNAFLQTVLRSEETAVQSLIEELVLTEGEEEKRYILRLIAQSGQKDRNLAKGLWVALDSLRGVVSHDKYKRVKQELEETIGAI